MEFKKKTIIWEDNNEPPKDYIWIKSDGKAYEYSYSQRKWIENKSISSSGNYEPIEANPTIEDGDVTTPLEALKVGNTTYSVPLSPMIVEGTIDDNNYFTPSEGAASLSDAYEQMFNGGLVYLADTAGGEPNAVLLATMAAPSGIFTMALKGPILWSDHSDEPPFG